MRTLQARVSPFPYLLFQGFAATLTGALTETWPARRAVHLVQPQLETASMTLINAYPKKL